MHEEAQKISLSNNFLKGKLRCHVDKIASIQKELLDLKKKNEAFEKAMNDSSCNNSVISTNPPPSM